MGHWNYRVIRHHYPEGIDSKELYEIHEVYYEDDGTLRGYAAPFNPLHGNNVMVSDSEEGLKQVYAMVEEAFDKPVLDEKDFE